MKDMLLIYLIIFKYNITCTAMILVYVLYQYYLMLLYHFIYTFNRRFFVCYTNVFIFRKLFLLLFSPFLKFDSRVLNWKKKLHKWYFILVSLYFFSRIYILIWLSCLNVSLKSNCLQIVLLFRLYGPREATRMSPTVKVLNQRTICHLYLRQV